MEKKYYIGDYLVYDTYGICKITAIKKAALLKAMPARKYYVLAPVNSPSSTFYVPTDNEIAIAKLRKPMTEKEIRELLSAAKKEKILWIENRQLRSESFHRVTDEGISPKLISLIGCLYERRQQLSLSGKKLSGTDEAIFAMAEKLVREEFAFSLDIPGEEVSQYIHKLMS